LTLAVSTPSNLVPERAYAVDVVLSEFLGLEYRHEPGAGDRVEIRLDGADARLELADDFFGRGTVLPGEPLARWDAARVLPEATLVEPILPVLFGTEPYHGPGRLGLDVFGAAFFMLTRYEELTSGQRDEHERFPAPASIAAREGFLHRPIVNEYAEILWAALARIWPRLERQPRTYRERPTHDVDHPLTADRQARRQLVSMAGDLIRRGDAALSVRRLLWLARGARPEGDPLNTFDLLMDLSEERGLVSAFYFIAGPTQAPLDGDYSLGASWIRSLLGRIHARGHEIGLHTSYGTFRDPERTRAEAERLRRICREEGIEQEAWGGRQHYLRWENPGTWQNWEDAGLDYDSTVGFADSPGFRSGTCFEHPVFNLETRRALRLRERPLIVMEQSALSYLGLGEEEALDLVGDLRVVCKRFGGDFVFLWHNSQVVGRRASRMYEQALDRSGNGLPVGQTRRARAATTDS
jgi:hypothetical protein